MDFSYYNNVKEKIKRYDISITEYVEKIKNGGEHEDFVFSARSAKQKGDEKLYKEIKSNSPAIMGSCLIRANAQDKAFESIDKLNGLILLDVDAQDQIQAINWEKVKLDPYVHLLHKSFGGDGYVIFIKSSCRKPEQFKYYYNALTDYFFNAYGIISDPSCKNPNRLRYISYDKELFFKETSIKWTNKEEPKKESIKKGYYFTGNNIIERIIDEAVSKGINIADDYENYLRIGFSLADEYGENGRDYFHALSQNSNKYDFDKADKQYSYITKSSNRGVTIGTLFHYFKEAGLTIYTDREKELINQTTNSKRSGVKNINDISNQIKITTGEELTASEFSMVKALINDKSDYSISANEELSDTEVLEKFIIDNYKPKLNLLTKNLEIKNKSRIVDRDINSIFITAKKTFDFSVSKQDVESILFSNIPEQYNPIQEFFNQAPEDKLTGYIDSFIDCIETDEQEFARKYFKKWLVSGVHNWTREEFNTQVSPLTLVLCGSKHGTGKTSFFRSILPKELNEYYIESKLKGDNDSLLLMTSSMILLDDEFGGKAFKENKAFKELSDKNIITVRRPYARVSEDFRRITLLAGTTNEIEVLKDPTGNRRIIPINVNSINLEKLSKIDTCSMLWEAYQLLTDGFEWVVRTQEDMDEISKHCSMNIDESAEVELINELFSSEIIEGWTNCVMTKGEIIHILSEQKPFIKWNKHSLNDWALKSKLKYKGSYCPRLKKTKKGYKIYKNPLNNIDIPISARPQEDDDMPF